MKKISIFFIILILLFTNCTKNNNTNSNNLTIFVSIAPQKFIVNELCKELAQCYVMVPPSKSPATYEPTTRDIINLANADVFFTIGVPFEKTFVPKIQEMMPNLPICDATLNISKRHLEAHSHEHHDAEEHEHHHHEHHDAEEEHHHHDTIDPHVWMSPTNMIIMAQSMLESIIALDSINQEKYKKNFDKFCDTVSIVEGYASEILEPYWGKTIFVSHPAFGYFTDEYGLQQISVEFNGKEPTSATLLNVMDFAKKEGIKTIFVQPEFSKKSAMSIAQAINGEVVELTPLHENYIEMIKDTAEKIANSFKN